MTTLDSLPGDARPGDYHQFVAGTDEGGQQLKPRSELSAAELMREVGSVLRMSEAEAAQLGDLPDDPVLHQCIVTYASDMSLLDTTLLPHAKWHSPDVFMASLDHAMWFHRPFRSDQWWLYDQDTPTATGGRGLARGHMWDRDGNLVASVVQEGLIRRMRG